MNNLNDQKLEKILEKTLEHLDSGKSPAEILDLFPEHQEILKEVFSTINLLKKERESIIPSRELLKQIIERLPVSVTNNVNPRYLYKKEVKGRPSLNNIITKIHKSMALKWKIIVPVGIVAVIAFLVIYSQFGSKAPQYTTEQAPTQPKERVATEATPPTATGNIDDVIAAFLQDSSNEALVFQEESGDADLIVADSQAISDFDQSYDENEF